MADQKKKLGDYFELQLDSGPVRVQRPKGASDEQWQASMKELSKASKVPTSIGQVTGKDGSRSAHVPPDDDAVVFGGEQGPRGVARGGISQERWDKIVKDAQLNPDYEGTYSKGKAIHLKGQEQGPQGQEHEEGRQFEVPADDDVVVMRGKDGLRSIRRGSMDASEWGKKLEELKADPSYSEHYARGKLVDDSGMQTSTATGSPTTRGEAQQGIPGRVGRFINSAVNSAVLKAAPGAEDQLEPLPKGNASDAQLKQYDQVIAQSGAGGAGGQVPGEGAVGQPVPGAPQNLDAANKMLSKAIGFVNPISSGAGAVLKGAEMVASGEAGQAAQQTGAALAAGAKQGLGAIGAGLQGAGFPALGQAASGAAEGIHPQFTGIPPQMNPSMRDGSAPVALQPGQPPAPGQTPAVPGQPLPGLGQNAGVGVSSSSSVRAPSSAIDTSKMNKAFDDLGEDEKIAFLAKADKRDQLNKLMGEEQQKIRAAEIQQVEQAKLTSEIQRKYIDGANSVVLKMSEPAARIDPSRYWADASVGKKALSVLAGALFGYTGKGMEWLAQLDNMVALDVQQQQMNVQNKRQGLNDEFKARQTAYGMARERGLDDAAAAAVATSAAYKGLQLKLESWAANTPDAELQAQLGQKIAAIESRRVELQKDVELASREAQLKSAQAYHLYQQSKAIGQGDGGKPPQALLTRMSDAKAGLNAIPDLQRALGSGKLGPALLDEVMKNIPGTDAKDRSKAATLAYRVIFSGIDRSVINKADQEFIDKFRSDVGWNSMNQGDVKQLEKLLKASYNGALSVIQQGRMNYGDATPYPDDNNIDGERER